MVSRLRETAGRFNAIDTLKQLLTTLDKEGIRKTLPP